MRVLHCVIAFALVTAFAMVVAVSFVFVVNRSNTNAQNAALQELFRGLTEDWARTVEDWTLLADYRSRILIAFNETAIINATLQADLQYLEAYVCQQYVRLNNVTPGCAGAFDVVGVGNVTIDNYPGEARVVINGTAFQTNEDQTLITQIMSAFAVTSLELSILNAEAVKTINGVTVDPNGNINVTGICGVEVKFSCLFVSSAREARTRCVRCLFCLCVYVYVFVYSSLKPQTSPYGYVCGLICVLLLNSFVYSSLSLVVNSLRRKRT
jgi:hypothetical protein